jgi:hypothetical protein
MARLEDVGGRDVGVRRKVEEEERYSWEEQGEQVSLNTFSSSRLAGQEGTAAAAQPTRPTRDALTHGRRAVQQV